MDEKTFDRLAADELKKLDRALTDLDASLEVDLASDILTLEFEDGRKFILNSHRSAKQIWFAANINAWHFSYDEVTGRWIDTRGGTELYALLSEVISKKLGRAVTVAGKK
jgi:CyaY protein